jgi:hypothetical protein
MSGFFSIAEQRRRGPLRNLFIGGGGRFLPKESGACRKFAAFLQTFHII